MGSNSAVELLVSPFKLTNSDLTVEYNDGWFGAEDALGLAPPLRKISVISENMLNASKVFTFGIISRKHVQGVFHAPDMSKNSSFGSQPEEIK